jgi:type I restriction enzyme S subunit
MSRIDDVVKQYAPNGVEHKILGDVARVFRGKRFVKADMIDSGVPCIHYGEIYTKYGLSATTSFSFLDPELAAKLRFAEPGDLVVATAGETVEDIGNAVAWLGAEPVAIHDACYAVRSDVLDPVFLSHLFRSNGFKDQIRMWVSSSKISSISTQNLARAVVPVPPIEVQREIVRILDDLTELGAQLKAELAAEIDARSEQLRQFRSAILSEAETFQTVRLEDVASYENGKAHERLVTPEGEVALMTARFISSGLADRHVPHADVLTPARRGDVALVLSDLPNGRALARTFLVPEDGRYAANQRVCLLRSRDPLVLDPEYFSRFMDRCPQLLAYNNGIDQTHLRKGAVLDVRVHLPPVEVQRRIASRLRELDQSIASIAAELEAEILARRQQHAFYRDRLLSFEEAA